MKLGASYSFFDGEELLRYSIKSIRDSVDYVVVVAQEFSYTGNPWTSEAKELCDELLRDGLVDNLVIFTALSGMSPHEQEVCKRNLGLDDCRKNGCEYIMSMDSDEFYKHDELIQAKTIIEEQAINISYCSFYMYYKEPIYREVAIPETKVAFMQKVSPTSKFVLSESDKYRHIALIDPTRTTDIGPPVKLYGDDVIMMHHMCHIRKDSLVSKYKNTSAYQHYLPNNLAEKLSEEYKNWKFIEGDSLNIIKVENIFNISI
jgi:hypothetical protein